MTIYRVRKPRKVIPIPEMSKPASAPVVPIGQPVKKHRGRQKGEPRPPSRPVDIIYADKMKGAFRTATLLIRRLKSLSRDKYLKESDMAREKYVAFLAKLNEKVDDCQPSSVADETLADWTG